MTEVWGWSTLLVCSGVHVETHKHFLEKLNGVHGEMLGQTAVLGFLFHPTGLSTFLPGRDWDIWPFSDPQEHFACRSVP